MILPREPSAGQPIGVGFARDVIRCLRQLRLVAGNGVSVSTGLSGTKVSAASVSAGVSSVQMARPWDVSFSGEAGAETATFEHCYFKRDSFTLVAGTGTLEYEMPTEPATLYVGFEYNTETRAVQIVSGSELGDVSESALPESDVELVYTPLYIMTLAGKWGIALDMRNMPVVGLAN